MNAVIVAVAVMLILSLLRVNVVFSLIAGAVAGGLAGGLGMGDVVASFTDGVGNGANIALSYALLGGFAIAISHTGLPNWFVSKILILVRKKEDDKSKALSKALIIVAVLIMACFSQNIIPIHIAFIPLLIPPLLQIMNELRIDRRLIASVLTFGLTAPYILLPVGFGQLFHQLLADNMEKSGLAVRMPDITAAMAIPVAGLAAGLLVAIFISYRKPRAYRTIETEEHAAQKSYSKRGLVFSGLAIIAALLVQIETDSMIFGALAGITILYISGSIKWSEADNLLSKGMQMMAFIGFVMIAASGFASVVDATGDVQTLVNGAADLIGNNKSLGALLMLIVGLLVTMGIGSSFSTIPIIATIFVPLSMQLGFSPMATIALVGTAAALGDAGSPASDSTLGPTAGLNADGQHNHIWDSCVPTFLHYNTGLIVFGWLAAMIL